MTHYQCQGLCLPPVYNIYYIRYHTVWKTDRSHAPEVLAEGYTEDVPTVSNLFTGSISQPYAQICAKAHCLFVWWIVLQVSKILSLIFWNVNLCWCVWHALDELHVLYMSNISNFRLLLAALHYNENSDREQATTSDGVPRFSLRFPKFKKGGYSVRMEKTAATYGMVQLS